ncbi:hypothetical protein [Hymenobacter sp. BRD67]|uniref:hypothetical protein n=1 Tax=Hymenobacter sp. BRD67 TaxID=2675877 RepID=UPI0015631A0A|nr:hypothetical protein [Hymenobacter sp. BRD67]QKG52698.1 hypothetical protein GKZ67_08915 [Hymenobacter sp. BRD67]
MTTASLFFLPLSILLSFSALAQTVSSPTVVEMTREMSARLQLNEGQFVKLLTLNRMRLTRQREIEQATRNDGPARTNQLAELQSQYEQECGRIMSPSQLSQLQQDETSGGGNG